MVCIGPQAQQRLGAAYGTLSGEPEHKTGILENNSPMSNTCYHSRAIPQSFLTTSQLFFTDTILHLPLGPTFKVYSIQDSGLQALETLVVVCCFLALA